MKFNITAVEKTHIEGVPVATVELPLKGIKIEGYSVFFEGADGVVCLEGTSQADLMDLEAAISDAAVMYRQTAGLY